jgi:hypothetical protein
MSMNELTTGEILLLEQVLKSLIEDGLIPCTLDDPAGWDRLAYDALGGRYPLKSYMVEALGDLIWVNSPSEWVEAWGK